MWVSASVKQLRERASDTVISILQRGATAEEGTAGCVLGRPHGLLLGYTRCLGPAVWEGGVASWAWGAAGSQSFKGPISPQGEMGRQWMDRCIWPGRGARGERSLEPSLGGRGKARWVIARPMQMMVVFWKQLRARWTGPQRPSFILLFLCKTRCQSLRQHQETSEPSAAVASSKGLGPCPHPHWG